MKIYVIVGIWQGCLNDVFARQDFDDARKKRDEMLEEYELTDDEPSNIHSQECRWNDENEVHLHEVELDIKGFPR